MTYMIYVVGVWCLAWRWLSGLSHAELRAASKVAVMGTVCWCAYLSIIDPLELESGLRCC